MDKTTAPLDTPASAPSANDQRREQLAALHVELREKFAALKAELSGVLGLLGRDGGRGWLDIVLMPIRLTFGLGLAVGVFWGLWQALVWLLS